jgi:hypothetical protein
MGDVRKTGTEGKASKGKNGDHSLVHRVRTREDESFAMAILVELGPPRLVSGLHDRLGITETPTSRSNTVIKECDRQMVK